MDNKALRKAVIRECIAALPENKPRGAALPYSAGIDIGIDKCRQALKALLPTPEPAEDPLLQEAREAVARLYDADGYANIAAGIRDGISDDYRTVQSAYAALKSREAK